jgi:hypothetical protein
MARSIATFGSAAKQGVTAWTFPNPKNSKAAQGRMQGKKDSCSPRQEKKLELIQVQTEPPVAWSLGWPALVNAPPTATEEETLRRCTGRGQPVGSPRCVGQTVAAFGLDSTLREPRRLRVNPGTLHGTCTDARYYGVLLVSLPLMP